MACLVDKSQSTCRSHPNLALSLSPFPSLFQSRNCDLEFFVLLLSSRKQGQRQVLSCFFSDCMAVNVKSDYLIKYHRRYVLIIHVALYLLLIIALLFCKYIK